MNRDLFLFKNYLIRLGYEVKKEMSQRLLSDPDSSIVSITNTLDYFEIDSVVAKVPLDSFDKLPAFFITQVIIENQENLVLVSKKEKNQVEVLFDSKTELKIDIKEFISKWSGIIIVAEENKVTKKIVFRDSQNILLIPLVISFLVYIFLTTNSFAHTIYFLLIVSGFFISYLIFKEKYGINTIANKFCKISRHSSCQTVFESKEAKLYGTIDLSDISITYFSFLTIVFLFNPFSSIYFILSIISLPIILYSVYHQYFNIKKWCPLCLGIAAILALQFLLLLNLQNSLNFNFNEILFFAIIICFTISSWLFSKPLLLIENKNHALSVENLSFRRNHNLFIPYFQAQIKVDKVISSSLKMIMGSNEPVVTITAITNPLCETCFEVHKTYKELLDKHSEYLQIEFLFYVPYSNRKDPRTKISERLLELYFEDKINFELALNEWYSKTTIKNWLDKWKPCENKKYNEILKTHKDWCSSIFVDSTPTIFINGKLFPQLYNPTDIEFFVEKIIELEQLKKTENIHA